MKIRILNYSDFEKVDTELVLLRGHIIDLMEVEVEGLHINDIRIKLIGEEAGEICYVRLGSVRIVQDSFSVLLTLFQGSNLISFLYKTQLIDQFHLICHKDAPTLSSDYKVKPLIVYSEHTCGTTENIYILFPYFTKIQIGLKLIQWYFSEKLVEASYPRRSFNLTDCSQLNIPLTPAQIQSMTSDELWEVVAQGIRASPDLWNHKYKYVAFSTHPWNQVTSEASDMVNSVFALEPKSAVAGGGLVLLDQTLLYSWPEKLDELFTSLEDAREVPDQSSLTLLMSTVGRQFGATLGIVAHELGHVFDLGHEERGLMGKDFHRFALTFQPKIRSALGLRTKRVYLTSGRVCEDPVQLCSSFLALVHYNRWFRESDKISVTDSTISLEKNLILSTTSISVIEVRNPESSIIISSWTGDRDRPQSSFALSKRFVPTDWANRPLGLLVQNISGSIFKADVHFSEFPQGATPIKRMVN